MRLVAFLLASWLLIAAGPIEVGPLQRCPSAATDAGCETVDSWNVRLGPDETVVRRVVTVDPTRTDNRPLMVAVIALASSEILWNGEVLGRNGIPALDGAEEVPGLYIESIMVPARLVRPGANVLTVRMTARHLWLPVYSPLHDVWVGYYETPRLPGQSSYLPALLMLGALLAGLVYFAATFLADRRDKGALALALASAATIAQLLIEVSRAFINYTYPWHLARVSAIALLAAATAILLSFYAARRFAPRWTRAVTLTATLLTAASVLGFPWFDFKALGAIAAGAVVVAASAAIGWRTNRRDAAFALAAVAATAALMIWDGTFYLDSSHYLLLGTILILLVAEQVITLRRARAERDEQTRLAAALAERLAQAERAGDPILTLKDGTRTHRVVEADILYFRAADDYSEAILTDARTLLVTMTLTKLLATLPPRFIRVHKSYAVNRARVTGTAPRPGGGRLVLLSDGSEIPIGRAYASAATEALS